MNGSYRYYRGAEGRFYCYSRDASYHCECAEQAPKGLTELAEQYGIDLDRMFRDAHRKARRLRLLEDEKPTDRCDTCGARLVKDGYATWVEAPWEQIPDDAYNEATRRINERLGASHALVPGSRRLWPRKKDAITHSLEQAMIDKEAAKEEAAKDELTRDN